MSKTRQRAPRKVIRLRTTLAWCREKVSHLLGKVEINDKFKLIAMSTACPMVAVSAQLLSEAGIIGPASAVFLLLMCSLFGAIVLTSLALGWLERHLSSFKSAAKTLGVGLVALASFVAHGQAVGEVNAIFGIDASALPHTTAAAVAMVMGSWIFQIILVPACFVSAICLFVFIGKSRFGEVVISFSVFIAALIWTALIFHQVGPELRRKSNLYQIALEMDFNKRSHCVDLPEDSEGVVFIGPDQQRALVAPRRVVIPTQGNFGVLVPQLQVPAKFRIVGCE